MDEGILYSTGLDKADFKAGSGGFVRREDDTDKRPVLVQPHSSYVFLAPDGCQEVPELEPV